VLQLALQHFMVSAQSVLPQAGPVLADRQVP
jgi:hypothetical protein